MYYVVDAETGEIVQYLTRPLPPARPWRRPSRLARAWAMLVRRVNPSYWQSSIYAII